MQETLRDGEKAAENMQYITDRMIWAGYALVGCLASYATYKILTKYLVKPIRSTYRFLTNQSQNMGKMMESRFGKGLVVVAGAHSGLQMTYAAYLLEIGYTDILLIGASAEKLEKVK